MSKKYVFWRMPTGKPCKGDDGRYAPATLLREIGEQAKCTPDGKGITWSSASLLTQNELAALGVAVIIGPDGRELNEHDASSILRQAVGATIKKQGGGKAVKPSDLVRCANDMAASHFRKPVLSYRLVSSLSLESLPCKRIRVGECELRPLAKQGRRYQLPKILERRRADDPYTVHLRSSKYVRVVVRTQGRSYSEATYRGLDALKLLCGLWTLLTTYGTYTVRMGATKREPIGVIHLGPVHTIHNTDGSPVGDIFWFEPSHPGEMKLFKPSKGWARIDGDRRWAARRIARWSYRYELEELIIQYAEALGQPDLDVAFLRLWNVLERITDTLGAKYDETIERAAWPFGEREGFKEKLEYLRFRRNQYVHASKSTEDADQAAYLIKSFVDPHLMALIQNEFGVGSLKEYGEFLAQPTNLQILKRRAATMRRAIRFLTRK